MGTMIWVSIASGKACCLTAPSRYLNQCWLGVKCVLWHTHESNVTRSALGPNPWWRHQMETFSALLWGNSPITREFPSKMPVTRSFGVLFDVRLNKRLSKQPWGWWFETPSGSLWRHCNVDPILSMCSGITLFKLLPYPPGANAWVKSMCFRNAYFRYRDILLGVPSEFHYRWWCRWRHVHMILSSHRANILLVIRVVLCICIHCNNGILINNLVWIIVWLCTRVVMQMQPINVHNLILSIKCVDSFY